MKLNRLIIILLMFSGIYVMNSCKTGDDDHMFEVNSYDQFKYGHLSVVYLTKPGIIQSWPCKKGKIRLYHDGRLLSFTLSEDHLLNNDLIPEGSRINLYQNGNPEFIRLAGDAEIQGQRIARNKRFSDILTVFYGDGSLKRFRSRGNTEINGIPCSDQSEIDLYPDGQLMVCQLHKGYSAGNKAFPAGTKLVVDEHRNIYEYSSDIHLSIESHFNLEKYITEKLSKAYDLRMNGRINQAYKAARDLSREGGFNPLVHYEMGRIKRHKLMGGDPETTYESILNSASDAVNMDRYNVAFRFYEADCASFSGYRTMMKGDTLTARRYYLRAIDKFEAVLRMMPDYHIARLSLVDIYSGLPEFLGGDWEKAIMHANELKDYDSVWAARAGSVLLTGDDQKLDYWLKIQVSYPDDPVVMYELGRAHLKNNDILNGEKCYRRAMELDSGRTVLLLDLARYHKMKAQGKSGKPGEHLEAAEAYILEYLETEPIQPVKAWCYAQMAGLYKLSGMEDEAVKFLRDAKKLDQGYLKEDRLPPMILYNPPGELSTEYYSYFDTY